MKNAALVGTIAALLAAICYGFIPFFTLPIKQGLPADFMSDPSILFYRFGFAALFIGLVMLVRRQDFKVTRGELVTLGVDDAALLAAATLFQRCCKCLSVDDHYTQSGILREGIEFV